MNCNDFHFQRKKDILEVGGKCGAAWSGGRARGQLGVGSCRAKWISEWLHQCGNILKGGMRLSEELCWASLLGNDC